MYTKPPVCVCISSNQSKMAKSCPKMVTVCSYEARACVSTYQTSWHHIPEECNAPCHHHEKLKTHNYFISCLLTSQCVSSAHSICTPYSTERGMNATWLVYLEHSGLLGCDSVSSHRWCQLLKTSTNTMALPSFDMSRTTCPMTQHHISDSLNPQQERCENLISWQLHLSQLCNFYVP